MSTIKLRRSATPGNVPTTGQLALGELAINTHDGKLYLKKDDGTASIVDVTNTDLVQDTTPQLGGDLDLNSSDITGTGNIDITGNITSTNITSTGNVGIGTSSPLRRLDVRGNVSLGPTNSSDSFQGMSLINGRDSSVSYTTSYIDFRNNLSTADAHIFVDHLIDGGSAIIFGTTPAGDRSTDRREERMRINSSGNVGIGTTNPTSKLHVYGPAFPLARIERNTSLTTGRRSTFSAIHTTSADMTDGFGADVSFGIRDSAGVDNEIANFGAIRDGADNSGALVFSTVNAGAYSVKAIIKANGNVGIGTTSPSSLLHVNGNITASRLIGTADSLTTARTISLGGDLSGSTSFDGSSNITITATVANDSHTHDGRYFTETESDTRFFRADAANSVDVRLAAGNGRGLRFWDADGYKIYMSAQGDATWGGRLDSSSDFNMYFRMSSGTNRGFVFKNGSTAVAQIDGSGDLYAGTVKVDGLTVDTNTLHVDSTNNRVGVGTTSPTTQLDVVGQAQIQANSPLLRLYDTDSATDEKYINLSMSNGALRFQYLNDSLAGGGDYIEFPRSGTAVLGMEFYDNAVLQNFISNSGDSYFTSGNVGIGTSIPVHPITTIGNGVQNGSDNLYISSSFMESYSTLSGVYLGYSVTPAAQDPVKRGWVLGSGTDSNLSLGTFTSLGALNQALNIDSSGRVGIGTTSPGYTLESAGTIAVKNTNPTFKLIDTDGTSTHAIADQSVNSNIYYHSTRTSADVFAGFNYLIHLGASGATLHRWYIGGSESMRLNSAGNVGIGTTNPRSGLHVFGAGQTTSNITDAGNQAAFLRVSDTGNVAGSGGGIIFASTQSDDTGAVGMAAIKGLLTNGNTNTIGDLAFSTRNATTDTALTERMRITNAGRVGIGTTSPDFNLDVVSSSNPIISARSTAATGFSQVMAAQDDYSSGPSYGSVYLRRYNDGATGTYLGVTAANQASVTALNSASFVIGTNGSTPIIFSTVSTEQMRITGAGKVGIGTTSPSTTLHVAGDTTFGGAIDETVYTLSGTSVALDPSNGTIQIHTLTGITTYTDSVSEGESITLMIDDGTAYTITWPTITWVNNGGSAPTLATSGYTVIAIWKVSTTLYGALVGDGS